MDFKKIQNRTGILLAGGSSSRMGSEKGLMSLHGKTFAEHIVETLSAVVHEVIIISNSDAYDFLGYKRYPDLLKNAGPLAGLYTGLHYSTSEIHVVASCDIPLINTKVYETLLDACTPDSEIVQCKTANKTMPLVGIYHKKCEEICRSLLDKGERRMMELANHAKTTTVFLKEPLDWSVQNINTPEELKAIQDANRD